MNYPDSELDCAAVCGNEVLICGGLPKNGNVRPILRRILFANYGRALTYAQDFDQAQRDNRPLSRR